MKPHDLAALSAFLDDEPVSPEALAEALAQPGGREALLDFVLVRAALREDPVPTERLRRALGREGAPAIAMRRNVRRWAAAAALILAAAALVRYWPREKADEATRPPAVTREEPFTEGVDWFRS